ncbi:type II secretion system pilot lipoprotein GspS [Erwinia sp. ErVv1]|uniref:type II secretion system pilot lipoprotein GspS n=1 Tax=Erwinia sp. ErVv1 TaxID=1603299 RepID=UPI00082AA338|nr:type II secretion system pilot lipoprotein GspS [Erwinia sp. ErVv1]
MTHKKYLFNFCAASLMLLTVTGCQQSAKKLNITSVAERPEIEQQVQQLSAIVGGGYYLKAKCHRSDLPSGEKMLSSILELAKQRSWPVDAAEYQQLAEKSEHIYQALLTDSTPIEQQCQYFNQKISGYFHG